MSEVKAWRSKEEYAEAALAAVEAGFKFDQNKLPLDLVPGEAIEAIARPLQYGLEKYKKRDSWKLVEDAERRYFAGYLRHTVELLKHGVDAVDPESGLLHAEHAACNLAFLAWFRAHRKQDGS